MYIITNFSMGDEAWFMYRDKAISSKVISITAIICFDSLDSIDNNSFINIRINYKFKFYIKYDDGSWEDINVEIPQRKVFRTRQELLNSL